MPGAAAGWRCCPGAAPAVALAYPAGWLGETPVTLDLAAVPGWLATDAW
jgi:hypothetical protein